MRFWISLVGVLVVGCGEERRPVPSTPGRFGEVTSAIVVVNPVINRGSTTTVAVGTERNEVEIEAADLDPVRTDVGGLALLEDLPTGAVPLRFSSGSVNLQVAQAQELYDVVVAFRGDGVEHVVPPVRYPIVGPVISVEPGGDLAGAVANDGAIVLLGAGNFPGNLELRAANVLVFGAWSPTEGPLSFIEGDVNVLGGGNRLRGVKVNGRLTSNANNFSAAFCDLASASITGNGVSLLRNRFTQGQASVPSSNAVLVDNQGIP